MNTRIGPVLSSRDLPLAELCCARLDGELFTLGEFWCPIDQVEGADSRAIAAGLLVPPRCIAERMTAAWIYGAAPEPLRHQFCVDTAARAHVPISPRVQVREVRRASDETRTISGIRVTTELRTVIDLARSTAHEHSVAPSADTDHLVPLLAALLRLGGFSDASPALTWFRRTPLPHKTLALRRLAEAQALLALPATTPLRRD